MKRLLFFVIMLAFVDKGYADNLLVGDITIPKGGKAVLDVQLSNTTRECAGFQFVMSLAEGVSVFQDGSYVFTEGDRIKGKGFGTSVSYNTEGGYYQVLSYNLSLVPASGTSGTIISITLQASGDLEVGTSLKGYITEAISTSPGAVQSDLADVEFNITIGEPVEDRVILDETSTTAPEDASHVNVRLNRTIKAEEWSTIVLPFAITGEQVKAAFGEDVCLAFFTDWESIEDGDENIVGINFEFTDQNAEDGIAANTPMLIKTSEDITTATFDDVTIEVEDEPSVMVKHGTKKKDPTSYMIGTYVANTVLENLTLFLSSNKFWYSAGSTKMKAYRAYFDIWDILSEVENVYNVKFNYFIDDEPTNVEGVSPVESKEVIYNLAGQRMSRMQRGVNIVNGKKIIKK